MSRVFEKSSELAWMWQDSILQVVRLAVLLGDLVLAPPPMFLTALGEWVGLARLLAGTQVLSMSQMLPY